MTVSPLLTSPTVDDPCGTPGCPEKRGYGLWSAFCQPCADRLAVVRESFDQETADFNPRNGNTHRFKQPQCCSPYCFAPRTPPDAFCAACQEAGFVEEAA